MNNFVKQYCGVKEGNYKNLNGDFRPSTLRVKGFKVNRKEGCKAFARSELAYIDILREKQKMRASKNYSEALILERAKPVKSQYNEENNEDYSNNFSETETSTQFWKKSFGIH